ncbi:UvrD-helicase domain-containing protein [Segatella paludivivens]|uniref:UvrD-helicase domain-containing protein n=1 Tax=Segatella paludivivens TaxID=185294 RepID=UPI00036B2F0C|nr:UvrD-helicase domain-containing protein [Segatella paludivivens]
MVNNVDEHADEQLYNCVQNRTSFFLFAGAGSGKTQSLIQLLNKTREIWGKTLMSEGRHVAVITYTNAATNEIINRLNYSPLFHVSTIHSFVWDVIKPYQEDIRYWYIKNNKDKLNELEIKHASSKSTTTKTYISDTDKINKIQKKIEKAPSIKQFIYNPNGNNLEYNSLNHSDVITISSQMILKNEMLQKIIAQQYPFLFIDESQDTKKELIDAFFKIQEKFSSIFTLGLLGDQKQRIYMDGKENLASIIPQDWELPVKHMNYRCSKRIVTLANKIGLRIDAMAEQEPKDDAPEGCVRLFLVNMTEGQDKELIEKNIREQMGHFTEDSSWKDPVNDVKVLTLEHLMAAKRLGFASLYEILSKVKKYSMTLLQGKLSELELFTKRIFPIVDSEKEKSIEALNILKKYSPLLSRESREDAYGDLKKCQDAVCRLTELIDADASIREVVSLLKETQLLTVSGVILNALNLSIHEIEENEDDADEELMAWVRLMELPISEMRMLDNYLTQKTNYDTHQGVKGLEFDRVMVIIDDSESKGKWFSYDKLFGVKKISETDRKNEEEGKETTVDRTMRLLYVTCTRAKKSLVLVMYTTDVDMVKRNMINNEWFEENEIIPWESITTE